MLDQILYVHIVLSKHCLIYFIQYFILHALENLIKLFIFESTFARVPESQNSIIMAKYDTFVTDLYHAKNLIIPYIALVH